jgi:hypothetical protein
MRRTPWEDLIKKCVQVNGLEMDVYYLFSEISPDMIEFLGSNMKKPIRCYKNTNWDKKINVIEKDKYIWIEN